jgi:hypothetical protein
MFIIIIVFLQLNSHTNTFRFFLENNISSPNYNISSPNYNISSHDVFGKAIVGIILNSSFGLSNYNNSILNASALLTAINNGFYFTINYNSSKFFIIKLTKILK